MKVSYSCTDNLQTILRNTTEKSSRKARHPPRKTNVTAEKKPLPSEKQLPHFKRRPMRPL